MPPILLLTDFGLKGPYVGQLHSAIASVHGGLSVIDFMHDLPTFSPERSAILLQAALPWLPTRCIVCAVVDPGVGSARHAIAMRMEQRWFVGPDNGLFSLITEQPDEVLKLDLPAAASASFHGRDLFAPAAAQLALGHAPGNPFSGDLTSVPVNRQQVIYVDYYGNAMTGLRAEDVEESSRLRAGRRELVRATTFSDRPAGTAFYYKNSWNLIEIAVNQGSAAESLGLVPGTTVQIVAV